MNSASNASGRGRVRGGEEGIHQETETNGNKLNSDDEDEDDEETESECEAEDAVVYCKQRKSASQAQKLLKEMASDDRLSDRAYVRKIVESPSSLAVTSLSQKATKNRKELTEEDLEVKEYYLWRNMERRGYTWSYPRKGGEYDANLVTFLYHAPGRSKENIGQKGVDHFTSEEDVVAFAKRKDIQDGVGPLAQKPSASAAMILPDDDERHTNRVPTL